jgi:uncharacterized protein YjiS (DUF1127 family)
MPGLFCCVQALLRCASARLKAAEQTRREHPISLASTSTGAAETRSAGLPAGVRPSFGKPRSVGKRGGPSGRAPPITGSVIPVTDRTPAIPYQSVTSQTVRETTSMSPRRNAIAAAHLATVSAASAGRIPHELAAVDRVAQQTRSQLRRIRQVLALWSRRHKDRAMLRSLSPRDLHDFCPRNTEAEAEMNKPFWRA